MPRAAQGVFESSRRELLVREETQELELYTGAPSYLVKEDCMIGVMESFYVVSTGARVSIMDAAKRARVTDADVASFFNMVGRRVASDTVGETVFPMGGYFNEFRREGLSAEVMCSWFFSKFVWPDQVLRCTVMVLTHLCREVLTCVNSC